MSANALARADVLLLQHHNARYICVTCEQKWVRTAPTEEETRRSKKTLKKVRRYVYQEEPARRREQRMDRQGRKAEERKKPVKGIVGLATVSNIPHFDRSKSAPPEYMHLLCLGVVRLMLKLWLEIPGAWNIKDKVKGIDKFIQGDVKVTDEFTRIPRRLKELVHWNWKASELRAWLLFISVPALQDALPTVYFQHYLLLVSAVYTLLKESITENDIIRAEIKLRMFVRQLSNLYGDRYYVYNVYNLLHLCEYVRKLGAIVGVLCVYL